MTDQGRDAVARRNRAGDRRASVPLHRLRENHRRGRTDPGGQARRRRCRPWSSNGGVGQPLKRYQGGELALGERPFVADLDAPGLLYGAVVLSAHARARIVSASTSPRRWRFPASSRSPPPRTCRASAGSARSTPTGPCFVAEGEEARCVGDVLAAVAAETAAHRARGGEAGRGRVRAAARGARPRRGAQAGRAAGQSQARQPAVGDALRARRRRGRAWPPRRTWSAAPGRRSASSTCSSSRRRASRAPLPDGRLHLYQPGPGHLRRPPADRRGPRRAGRAAVRRAGAERRRVRRQGGHDDPGADGAARAPDRAAGADRAHPRGVDPHAPQAPPDHHDLHGRAATPRAG